MDNKNSGLRRRGRRPDREAARTRERIVRRAERLFSRQGYAGTALREIARAAGVGPYTVRHHFGSKKRLYEEILRRWDADVERVVSAALAGAAPGRDAAEATVEALFELFRRNRRRVLLAYRAALGDGIPPRLALGDRHWLSFMRQGMAIHGLGRGLDPALLLITIEGILHNHVLATPHYRLMFGRDLGDAALARRVQAHLRAVLGTLLAGGHSQSSAGDRSEP